MRNRRCQTWYHRPCTRRIYRARILRAALRRRCSTVEEGIWNPPPSTPFRALAVLMCPDDPKASGVPSTLAAAAVRVTKGGKSISARGRSTGNTLG
ncbi:hypothetical protein MRX96_039906 [Rhipicephalus microplus]